MPLVSVVIPVYNVEKYLDKCIQSVLSNSYRSIELICVNDGSKDKSLSILQKYARLDERVKVIDQPNGGVSSARNAGIKYSTGKYLAFIDADDYVSSDYFEKLVSSAEAYNADIVACGSLTVYEDGSMPENNHAGGGTVQIVPTDKIFKYHALKCYVWGRLYLKDAIQDLLFNPKLKLGEDTLFNLTTICSKDDIRIISIEDKLYYHTDRMDSAVKILKVEEHFLTIREGYLKNYERFGKNKDLILIQTVRRLLSIRMQNNEKVVQSECKKLLRECQKHFADLHYKDRIIYSLVINCPYMYKLIRKIT